LWAVGKRGGVACASCTTLTMLDRSTNVGSFIPHLAGVGCVLHVIEYILCAVVRPHDTPIGLGLHYLGIYYAAAAATLCLSPRLTSVERCARPDVRVTTAVSGISGTHVHASCSRSYARVFKGATICGRTYRQHHPSKLLCVAADSDGWWNHKS
jgi:hypothetical protein